MIHDDSDIFIALWLDDRLFAYYHGDPKSSCTANGTRNSSTSGRRPLRVTTGVQLKSSSNGDDDNDENKKRTSGKLSSQCENNDPVDKNQDGVASSTRIEQSNIGSALFEMSILNSALSRVWNATRNATLFGARVSPIALNSTRELYENGTKELCYTGTAQPEITPVFKQKSITPARKSSGRSVSNYLKAGPYDIPPTSLLKRRTKSKINQHHLGGDKGSPLTREEEMVLRIRYLRIPSVPTIHWIQSH
ncbi:hypothetical protein ACHWQZ_G008460 [Mnemiopsis leidyi]